MDSSHSSFSPAGDPAGKMWEEKKKRIQGSESAAGPGQTAVSPQLPCIDFSSFIRKIHVCRGQWAWRGLHYYRNHLWRKDGLGAQARKEEEELSGPSWLVVEVTSLWVKHAVYQHLNSLMMCTFMLGFSTWSLTRLNVTWTSDRLKDDR